MQITVLALNPSIDLEWRVRQVRWEEKNVVESERRWPGGKGVNVARWIAHLRGKPVLLATSGGTTGRQMECELRREGLRLRVVRLREPTRTNLIVTPPRGQLRFNPPGPRVSRSAWREVLKQFDQCAPRTDMFVLSGSLPRGLPATAYGELIRRARRWRKPVCVDCDGAAFAAAVRAQPFLVKPNQHELEAWWVRPLRSQRALLDAIRALARTTRGWVLVSRGEDGADLANATQRITLSARAPRLQSVNTVGAGDALLAAVTIQIVADKPPAEWLRWGVATGSAAVQVPAGRLPSLPRIRLLARRLSILEQ